MTSFSVLQKPNDVVLVVGCKKRKPYSYIPNAGKKNEKTKKKKKKKNREKKGKETHLLKGVPLESFELKVRRVPLTPLLRPREGESPQLRRGVATVHRVRLRLGTPFTTMG